MRMLLTLVLLTITTTAQAATMATQDKTNTFTGRQDATNAASTAPAKTSTVLPSTCVVGDVFFKSDATAGQNLYYCATTNTWTQQLNTGEEGEGGVPGGSTTQLQYNDAGAFAGISGAISDGTNLTLATGTLRTTLPRITTGLHDANGNPILAFTPIASAVDGLTVTNAAAANPAVVLLSGTGSDTNISLGLVPKGTGTVNVGSGVLGSTSLNTVVVNGASSGVITVQPQAAAGTYNWNWPITAGTSGSPLLSGGGGAAAMSYGTRSGNTTVYVTTTGTQTAGNCLTIDASGNHTPTGATCAAGVETLTNKTLDVTATGNVITTIEKRYFPMVSCAGTVATPLWNGRTSSAAGVATCTEGVTLTTGYMRFANSALTGYPQMAWMLPSDFIATGMSALVKWRSVLTSGTAAFTFLMSCTADGAIVDATGQVGSGATDAAKDTTLQLNDVTWNITPAAQCTAGSLMHMILGRNPAHASDDLAGDVDIIGLELTYRRTQ